MTEEREVIAAAFTEWDRRHREEPTRFESDFARLARGEDCETYGDRAALYLAELIAEAATERALGA